MNMTLDGFCDHTAMGADEEIHQHYSDLINNSGALLYGRITYQLMEYWRSVLANPTGDKAMDDFAIAIDRVPKIVYSRTLEGVDWKTATLKREIVKEEILELKFQDGLDLLVGSPGLIVALGNLGLIDEYQIGIHPTVVGSGLPLFKNITERIDLKLIKTKTFGCGAVVMYYEAVKGGPSPR